MRRNLVVVLAALVSLPVAACGGRDVAIDPAGSPASALSVGIPQRSDMTLDLKAVQSSAGAPGASAAATTPPTPACVGQSPATFAAMTAQIMQQSNGILGDVLTVVENVTSGPPAGAGPGVAVWGPITPSGNPSVYRVEVVDQGSGSYHFELDGSPSGGAPGTWSAVMQGTIVTPDPAHRAGSVQIDFGVAYALNPSASPTAGGVAIQFQADPADLTLDETFAGIVGQNVPSPNDAHYHLEAGPATAAFDYMTTTDFLHNGGSELLNVQSQWLAVGAGKANVVVTGGDLGSKTVQAAECWDHTQAAVFYADDISAKPPSGNPACCPP